MTAPLTDWLTMTHFSTLAIHAGYDSADCTNGNAAVPPIYLSAAFDMQSAAHGDALSAGAAEGFSYSRMANPTLDVLERRIAALEGGRSAVAFASGMAAVSAALLCAAEGGGRIITARNLYSASVDAMDSLFPEFGIETDFVDDINDLALVELLIGPDTRAIFAESVANPSTEVADVAALASVAHRHGIPLIIDNTVPTPYLFRPIELGADVAVHSPTKGIGEHGNALGGIVVDAGRFDWATDRYPQFTRQGVGSVTTATMAGTASPRNSASTRISDVCAYQIPAHIRRGRLAGERLPAAARSGDARCAPAPAGRFGHRNRRIPANHPACARRALLGIGVGRGRPCGAAVGLAERARAP